MARNEREFQGDAARRIEERRAELLRWSEILEERRCPPCNGRCLKGMACPHNKPPAGMSPAVSVAFALAALVMVGVAIRGCAG